MSEALFSAATLGPLCLSSSDLTVPPTSSLHQGVASALGLLGLKTSSLRPLRAVPEGADCRAHRYRSKPWGQASRADPAGARGKEHSQLAQDRPWASAVSGNGL